jgi:hypothetical protein
MAEGGRGADAAVVVPQIGHDAYPALFQTADASSIEGQRTYRRLVKIELAFVLFGAMFGTAAALVPDAAVKGVLATLATICLLGSMAMKFVNRYSDSTERWFDGRAVAETVKTQAWRYMMRTPPYDEESGDRRFATDVIAAMRARPNLHQSLEGLPTDAQQITPAMRAVRGLPFHERRRIYLEQRLASQSAWYHGKAVANRRNARRWFWLSLIGQGAAALIAFTSIFEPQLPLASLVGFFAALATAATAWTQLGRHDELSRSYALAYQELIAIRTLAEGATSQASLAQVVNDGEGAISREHTMWVAKRELQTGAGAPTGAHPADAASGAAPASTAAHHRSRSGAEAPEA